MFRRIFEKPPITVTSQQFLAALAGQIIVCFLLAFLTKSLSIGVGLLFISVPHLLYTTVRLNILAVSFIVIFMMMGPLVLIEGIEQIVAITVNESVVAVGALWLMALLYGAVRQYQFHFGRYSKYRNEDT